MKMNAKISQSKRDEYKKFHDYGEIMNRVNEKKSGDRHLYLRRVKDEYSFKLKTDHSEIIAEILFLEDLHKAIQEAPSEAITFHTERGNDFAEWISYAVGDWWLGSQIGAIKKTDSEKVRSEMLKLIGERISRLRLI